jgi:hypothetical protein
VFQNVLETLVLSTSWDSGNYGNSRDEVCTLKERALLYVTWKRIWRLQFIKHHDPSYSIKSKIPAWRTCRFARCRSLPVISTSACGCTPHNLLKFCLIASLSNIQVGKGIMAPRTQISYSILSVGKMLLFMGGFTPPIVHRPRCQRFYWLHILLTSVAQSVKVKSQIAIFCNLKRRYHVTHIARVIWLILYFFIRLLGSGFRKVLSRKPATGCHLS